MTLLVRASLLRPLFEVVCRLSYASIPDDIPRFHAEAAKLSADALTSFDDTSPA